MRDTVPNPNYLTKSQHKFHYFKIINDIPGTVLRTFFDKIAFSNVHRNVGSEYVITVIGLQDPDPSIRTNIRGSGSARNIYGSTTLLHTHSVKVT